MYPLEANAKCQSEVLLTNSQKLCELLVFFVSSDVVLWFTCQTQ